MTKNDNQTYGIRKTVDIIIFDSGIYYLEVTITVYLLFTELFINMNHI